MTLFANPLILVLLLFPLALFFYFFIILKKKQKEALKFSETSFVKSSLNAKQPNRYTLLMSLSLLALCFFIIGFSDPFLPFGQTHSGANVVILLDTSGNMKADDYSPSRFLFAREFALDLIESLDDPHNVGVITFDESASVVAFLTPDKQRIANEIMRNIERSNGRTSLSGGLTLAIEMASSVEKINGFVVLITDGENDLPTKFSINQLIEIANAKNVKIFSIGVGSHNPHPLDEDLYGVTKYAYLNEKLLQEIPSSIEGSKYMWLPKEGYSNIIANITKSINISPSSKPEKGSGDIFFILGIITFLLYLYLVYWTKSKIP